MKLLSSKSSQVYCQRSIRPVVTALVAFPLTWTPLTPAGVPTAKTPLGRQLWLGIHVPAAWHCQQSPPLQSMSIPPDSYRDDARVDCTPETPNCGRDSSVVTRRRMSTRRIKRGLSPNWLTMSITPMDTFQDGLAITDTILTHHLQSVFRP